MSISLRGLIAAPHTPFDAQGELQLDVIERQVEHLLAEGVVAAFVCGTTGEGMSLTLEERQAVAQRWVDTSRGTRLSVIVHVGCAALRDARNLAAHAARIQATAIAALAPFYHRPPHVTALVDCCRQIAAAAPALPFFYYHIPSMTQIRLSMSEFLERGSSQIPNLAGLKYTDDDLMQLQECLAVAPDRLQILHGFDEILLAGLALGVRAATGSTYNFAARLYHDLIAAFEAGDLPRAAQRQQVSVRLVRLLARYDFAPAAKAMMRTVGIDCGPVRPPLQPLSEEAFARLECELQAQQLLPWIGRQ